MLEFYRSTPKHFRTNPHHMNLAKPIFTTEIGVYKKLTPNQIQFIEAGCSEGMEYMNYQFTSEKPKTTVEINHPSEPGFIKKVINAIRYYGLNAYRWRMGIVRWKIVLRLLLPPTKPI